MRVSLKGEGEVRPSWDVVAELRGLAVTGLPPRPLPP